MKIYNVHGKATVSVFAVVRADSPEEALLKAKQECFEESTFDEYPHFDRDAEPEWTRAEEGVSRK